VVWRVNRAYEITLYKGTWNMEQNSSRRTPAPAAAVRTEQVLESYYGQLMAWGTLLTRGDVGQAQDVVHDFYLHLTLTKPDLSGVANLDGYLDKSLRHIVDRSISTLWVFFRLVYFVRDSGLRALGFTSCNPQSMY
jgi:hypothetical protein